MIKSKKTYSSIMFPIEEDFHLDSKEVSENLMSSVKSFFLAILFMFSKVIYQFLNVNSLLDKNWFQKNKFHSKTYILNALIYVDHYHSVKIFKKFNLELDHFIYIFFRKFFLVGNKKELPVCLETNFQLRLVYELSNFRLNDVLSRENIEMANKLFFDKTSSLESLISGRNILGSINDKNYQYLMNKYFN